MNNTKLQPLGSDYTSIKSPSNVTRGRYIAATPDAPGSEYWTLWDANRLNFGKLENKVAAKDASIKYQEIEIKFNYGTVKKPEWGTLDFEMPFRVEDGELRDLILSFNGVREKKANAIALEEHNKKVKSAKKKGKVPPEFKVKHRIICPLDTSNPSHSRFVTIMRELYVACLKALFQTFGDAWALPACPEEEICETKESLCLRYPILYKRDNEGKGKVIPGSPPAMDLSVTAGGAYATKFIQMNNVRTNANGVREYDVDYLKFEKVLNRGFLHIPHITFPNIFLGSQKLIRIQCTETLIYKFTNTTVSTMADTLNTIAGSGIVTQEDVEAGNVLKDLMVAEKEQIASRSASKIEEPINIPLPRKSVPPPEDSSTEEEAPEEIPEEKPRHKIKVTNKKPAPKPTKKVKKEIVSSDSSSSTD